MVNKNQKEEQKKLKLLIKVKKNSMFIKENQMLFVNQQNKPLIIINNPIFITGKRNMKMILNKEKAVLQNKFLLQDYPYLNPRVV